MEKDRKPNSDRHIGSPRPQSSRAQVPDPVLPLPRRDNAEALLHPQAQGDDSPAEDRSNGGSVQLQETGSVQGGDCTVCGPDDDARRHLSTNEAVVSETAHCAEGREAVFDGETCDVHDTEADLGPR